MNKEERTKKFGDYVATLTGNLNGKNVNFKLRYLEIKHIRRCLNFYDLVYDREYPNIKNNFSLTKAIYGKFSQFGKMTRRMSVERSNRKMKDIKKVCSFEGCNAENITVSHIKPLASTMENPNAKENLEYLCPKHHLLKELKHILWQKYLELNKLKKRIEEIETKSTTDCLGYQTKNNNLECIDE